MCRAHLVFCLQGKPEAVKIHYEYFDPGSHWCGTCNIMCGHMFDFFKHLESKKHQQVRRALPSLSISPSLVCQYTLPTALLLMKAVLVGF